MDKTNFINENRAGGVGTARPTSVPARGREQTNFVESSIPNFETGPEPTSLNTAQLLAQYRAYTGTRRGLITLAETNWFVVVLVGLVWALTICLAYVWDVAANTVCYTTYAIFSVVYSLLIVIMLVRSGWFIVVSYWMVRVILFINFLAVKNFSDPILKVEGDDVFELAISFAQIESLLLRDRTLSRDEIVAQLLSGNVESNPGPPQKKKLIKCKKCQKEVADLREHFKAEHPTPIKCHTCHQVFDASEIKQHRLSAHPNQKKQETKADLVDKQVAKEEQQQQGNDDAAQQHVQVEVEKKQDQAAEKALTPQELMKEEMVIIEMEEDLAVAQSKYTTPNTQLPRTKIGDDGDSGFNKWSTDDTIIYLYEDRISSEKTTMPNVLHIGAVEGWYFSTHTYRHVPFYEFCYAVFLWVVSSYTFRLLEWLTNYFTANLITGLVASYYADAWVAYVNLMFFNWLLAVLFSVVFLSTTQRGIPKLPLCWVFGNIKVWLQDTYDKIKICLGVGTPHTAILVGVPISTRLMDFDDRRPEVDRSEHRAKLVRQDYQIAVAISSPEGFRLYRDYKWTYGQWYKRKDFGILSDPRLITVRLDNGLMATALNRLTMTQSKKDPTIALESTLRLMKSNSAYQEDYNRLYNKGRSMYRDMALVCGAIVTKDIGHDNIAF